MITQAKFILEKIIWICFLALAILTPLLFSTINSEIFELPKMYFVYTVSSILFFATLTKIAVEKKFKTPTFPTFIIFLIFLAFLTFQTLSTFMSIDKFTSIFGYPTRLNGGLLSQFAYFAIFISALLNLNNNSAKKILFAAIIGTFAVVLWGIPSHFGYDPTCFVLTQKLTSSCWQKDFDPTLRIFSTLGQPNWLASYLVLILPATIAFALKVKDTTQKYFLLTAAVLFFLALVLTTSRAGMLGAFTGLMFLFTLNVKTFLKQKFTSLALATLFVVSILIFGNFLLDRISSLITSSSQTPTGNIESIQQSTNTDSASHQVGTESSVIRLIVWQGAIEAFKNKPILGHGPETFAYSYYKYRPNSHNLTTEWNFFYNKAHNEFLNYLANIGALGTSSYILLMVLTVLFLVKRNHNFLLTSSLAVGIIAYQVTIFFGFATVATQTLMYLLIPAGLAISSKKNGDKIALNLNKSSQLTFVFILFLAFTLILVFSLRLFFADMLYARAQNKASLVSYKSAIETFPSKNPFLLADSAKHSASLATNSQNSSTYEKNALDLVKEALSFSPNNLIVARRAANTYILLSQVNENHKEDAISLGNNIVSLAPTDPQSYLTQAKLQVSYSNYWEAKISAETALELKPTYIEAKEVLHQINDYIVEN